MVSSRLGSICAHKSFPFLKSISGLCDTATMWQNGLNYNELLKCLGYT